MMTKSDKTADLSTRSLPSRLERLRALKEGRELADVTNPVQIVAPPAASGGTESVGKPAEKHSLEMLSVANPTVKKMLRVMASLPKDGTDSTIDGTPFTQTGVTRIMKALAEKSRNPEDRGAKMASAVLDYLTPQNDEDTAGGASLDKLRALARLAGSQQGKRG